MNLNILDNATGQLEIKIRGRNEYIADLELCFKGGRELIEAAKAAATRGFTKFQHGGKWHRAIIR